MLCVPNVKKRTAVRFLGADRSLLSSHIAAAAAAARDAC